MADFLRVTEHDRVGWIDYHRPPVDALHWEMLREVLEGSERPPRTPPPGWWRSAAPLTPTSP